MSGQRGTQCMMKRIIADSRRLSSNRVPERAPIGVIAMTISLQKSNIDQLRKWNLLVGFSANCPIQMFDEQKIPSMIFSKNECLFNLEHVEHVCCPENSL